MIINNDCLDEMRKMEENSISAIVTDPPYGLSFMGKGWDREVPGVEYWRECFRIAKPGSFLIAMGGTRTFHRLTCAIEDAGFEIRDCISWLYGSGFPKSHNSFGLEGFGTALKPAWEPCIVAMKPCDGTFKQNAEKWGQAGINIDACRIGTDDTRAAASKNALGIMNDDGWKCKNMIVGSAKGRWPANVIFDEEAAKMLDEQSGVSKSTGGRSGNAKAYGKWGKEGFYGDEKPGLGDSGGASRFFYCAKTSSRERNEGLEGMPLGKPVGTGRSKPDIGRQDPSSYLRQNNHPTVKPLKLMRYLITLIMLPKDGILLDPFAGSGSTILAAHQLGIKAIGIEKSPEYCEIARKRIENWKPEKDEPDLFQNQN